MSEIPKGSRLTVYRRDKLRCLRCNGRGTDWHHRRPRSVVDRHVHCPCNGILLCRKCHDWVHAHPVSAQRDGYIVSRFSSNPGEHPLYNYTGGAIWFDCEGRFKLQVVREERSSDLDD